jgi:excisionase family DNA binding protein
MVTGNNARDSEEAEMNNHDHIAEAGLSVLDAARIAGIGRSTIYEELAAGRLVARKCGSRTIIPASALSEWMDKLPSYTATKGALR